MPRHHVRGRNPQLAACALKIGHVLGGEFLAFVAHSVRLRRTYSTTFGTRKKWSWVAGAFLSMSSAISPSVTTSGRFFIPTGVTEVMGSTPEISTPDSGSTKTVISRIPPLI